MFTKIWWVHTVFTKKDEKKEKKKVIAVKGGSRGCDCVPGGRLSPAHAPPPSSGVQFYLIISFKGKLPRPG